MITGLYRDGEEITKDQAYEGAADLWLNAFTLINPTPETCEAIGREVVRQLEHSDLKLWPGRGGRGLVLRVAAS